MHTNQMEIMTKQYDTRFQKINWPRFLAIIWLLWTIHSLSSTFSSGFYQASKGNEIHWLHIFWYNYTSAIIWAGFTPLILWNVFRISIESNKWASIIFKHLLFALVISAVQRFLYLSADYFVQNYFDLWGIKMTYKEYLSSMYFIRILNGVLTYFIIAALLYGYFYYLKNLENKSIQNKLIANLNKSRIQNLKYQIQPHFLFNSMQVISNLMYKNVEKADDAITELSDLLRLSIRQLDVDEILLKEEMSAIEKYLNFQKLRFGENVVSVLNCDPDLYACKVPAMLLQPFVENAIKYGFEKTGNPTSIDINIEAKEQKLSICIKDNGPGFTFSDIKNSSGIGIKNVINRLDSLYHDQYDFQLQATEEGMSINIILPIKLV